MRTRCWFILLFSALTMIAATNLRAENPTSVPGETKTYSFEKEKFKLGAPASWVDKPSNDANIPLLLIPDVDPPEGGIGDVFLITVTPLSELAELAKLENFATGAVRGATKGDPNAKAGAIEDTTVDGEAAKRFTVDKLSKGKPSHAIYVVIHRNHNFYVILYLSDPAHSGAAKANVETLLKSFKWL
jgi:photosystem II reaction center protein PsbP